MTRKSKLVSLLKAAHGSEDPDRAIQQKIFDYLVKGGLSEELAAMVVSNIGRMDLRDLWKKMNKRNEEGSGSEYGWGHSCGETFHQLDSPGNPCPSCGESGDWEWHDDSIENSSEE